MVRSPSSACRTSVKVPFSVGSRLPNSPFRRYGVWVVNILTGQTIAFVKFEDAVQELFAVQVLPGVKYPDLINDQPDVFGHSFIVPDDVMGIVPESLRHIAQVNH